MASKEEHDRVVNITKALEPVLKKFYGAGDYKVEISRQKDASLGTQRSVIWNFTRLDTFELPVKSDEGLMSGFLYNEMMALYYEALADEYKVKAKLLNETMQKSLVRTVKK